MRPWYTLTVEQLYSLLNTAPQGLDGQEAAKRLKEYGYNELDIKGEPIWKKIIEPFRSVFIAVLAVAAAISYFSGKTIDMVIILSIITINSIIYYSQQHATSRVLRSLKKHSEQFVQVLHDGQLVTAASRLLVPGDIIVLSEGQRIPADARVIEQDNLHLDESALTGESLPIKKSLGVLAAGKELYERSNMLFQGTYVVSGTGKAVVVATGGKTEFGTIAKLATEEESKSPTQHKVDGIVSRLIKIIAIVAAVAFALSLMRDIPANEALRFVLALSVSAVPESLPIALSVIVVIGMRRMAKKNALVRSMKAIEDIGLVTTVATDKTGTLTKNNLKVVEVWGRKTPGLDFKQISFRSLGDTDNAVEPFDKALKEFAGKGSEAGAKLLKNYPFNQKFLMSGGVWQEAHGSTLYIKGAPEHIIGLSRLSAAEHAAAESELRRLVSKGFRVIALATARLGSTPADLSVVKKNMPHFVGLIAFADELRPESKQAIAEAHQAGISVKMITGDHFETAYHIGQELGIGSHRDQIVSGSQLPSVEAQLDLVVKSKTIFARILPEQKFSILKSLKKTEITAMTGDGVNDVPALANANVGIAMGSGNDIAKDAGDIVLLDNNFASIVRAISEGRIIYDNIRRMLFYLLATTFGEVVTMIGALLIGLPLPVTAIQILWINLVTDTALVIPLGLEPAEKDHMKRPPRAPSAPILDKIILTRVFIVGATMAAVTLGVFAYLIHAGYRLEYAQTVAFMMLVAAQWMNAFNARSEHVSAIVRARVPNYKLLAGLTLAVLFQSLVMFGPLQEVFGIQNVNLGHLAAGSIASILAVLLVVEIHKKISGTMIKTQRVS